MQNHRILQYICVHSDQSSVSGISSNRLSDVGVTSELSTYTVHVIVSFSDVPSENLLLYTHTNTCTNLK